jgi:hypothetical protein
MQIGKQEGPHQLIVIDEYGERKEIHFTLVGKTDDIVQ